MKRLPLFSSILAFSLAVSPPAALAHVGHGDEFQAEGGVNRVEVKAQTDSLLGIQVNPIEPAADGTSAVMIPVSALVEDNGRQLVFVEYENFYEPVDVTIGESSGELIEITEGLSVGEQLVTQGSLSLYAESRKTQTTGATPNTDEVASQEAAIQETAVESSSKSSQASGGSSIGWILVIGSVTALVVGAVVFFGGGKQKGGI